LRSITFLCRAEPRSRNFKEIDGILPKSYKVLFVLWINHSFSVNL
jgi:hypothetical protein